MTTFAHTSVASAAAFSVKRAPAAPRARRNTSPRTGVSGMTVLIALTLLATSLFHWYGDSQVEPDLVTYAFRV